jgi:hypothetical protein
MGWADFRIHAVAICDQHCLAADGKPNVLIETGRLSQPHAGTPAVLIDEPSRDRRKRRCQFDRDNSR